MSNSRLFELHLDSGQLLHGVVDLPAAPGPRPTVIICHGFKGFMEWGFFPHLAELLAARGFTVVRFNFSGGGMRPGDDLVSDPEAFAHATIGQDVREIEAVLDAVTDGRVATGRVDDRRLALVGHSRGGGTSILAAARGQRFGALVTWSAVATFDRLTARDKVGWRSSGQVPIVNARTGQELALDISVLDDLEARNAEYDLAAAASRIQAPWLIVHGEDDETVPVAEARSLATAASPNGCLEVVSEASHTFGAVHPFVGPTRPLIEAFNLTQAWLRRHLG